jgi:hypothetical protein
VASSLAALVLEAPPAGSGVQIGSRTGDRVVVQLAMPAGVGVAWWDVGHWDQQVFGGTWSWVDVTCDVREFATQRGRDTPLDRFRVGTAAVTLTNVDRKYSTLTPPATSPYVVGGRSALGAGTVMRVGYLCDGSWWPTFTGVAEQWTELPDYPGGDNALDVTLVETTSDLATVDRPATTSQGNGETGDQRFARLLADAGWRWPTRAASSVGASAAVLATTMEGNRLGECYLTADSLRRTRFYADADGAARWDDGVHEAGVLGTICFDKVASGRPSPADTVLADDTLRMVNDVTMARVGSTAVRVVDNASRDRFGPYTYQRMDLVAWTDTDVVNLAGDLVTAQAWDVRRIDAVTVTYPQSAPVLGATPLVVLARMMTGLSLRSQVDLFNTAAQPSADRTSTVEALRHHVLFGVPVVWEVSLALSALTPAGPYTLEVVT